VHAGGRVQDYANGSDFANGADDKQTDRILSKRIGLFQANSKRIGISKRIGF
jgi:hypothetical protein